MQIFRKFDRYAEEDKFTYVSACLFFVLTILTAAFVISNLIVAIVTTNLDRATKELRVWIADISKTYASFFCCKVNAKDCWCQALSTSIIVDDIIWLKIRGEAHLTLLRYRHTIFL